MSSKLFSKVNKKSGCELEDVVPEIRGLTIELAEHVRDSFKFIREILIRISKIVGPFWFHIPDSILEDGCYEVTRILTDISNYLHPREENDEIIRESPTNYVEDMIEELHHVIGGRIRGIIVRVRKEWRNIKNEAIREKVREDVRYVVHVFVELLTDLREGEKKIASLFVKNS